MIRHVVAWTLASEDPEQRAKDAAGIKAGLEALNGVIDGLSHVEVGIDVGIISGNWDAVLVSEFDDNKALEGYQIHPDHLAVVEYIKGVTNSRMCVDYDW
jgi:hypothetical protein